MHHFVNAISSIRRWLFCSLAIHGTWVTLHYIEEALVHLLHVCFIKSSSWSISYCKIPKNTRRCKLHVTHSENHICFIQYLVFTVTHWAYRFKVSIYTFRPQSIDYWLCHKYAMKPSGTVIYYWNLQMKMKSDRGQ